MGVDSIGSFLTVVRFESRGMALTGGAAIGVSWTAEAVGGVGTRLDRVAFGGGEIGVAGAASSGFDLTTVRVR